MRQALETTDELDYKPALEWFGLQFTPSRPPAGFGQQIEWQGLRLRRNDNRLIVAEIRRDTPADASGINVEDEILALDEYRVIPGQWDSRVELYQPGDTVSVLVSRRDSLARFDLKIGPADAQAWRLRPSGNATPAQQEHLRSWFTGQRGALPA
jgi:predicted metalloprotease with PDZ domain